MQITAYAFAKHVNFVLAMNGIEKVLPPQMFYTYFKKGFIKTPDQTTEGADRWVTKYAQKHFQVAVTV